MKTKIESERKNVWPYIVWPPLILNIGSVLIIGATVAFKYATTAPQSPGSIQISSGQIQFSLSILIFLVEWLFALLLLYRYRKSNESVRSLFSRTGNPLQFRWGPAILLFLFLNLLFIGYILYLVSKMPDLTYRDMTPLQVILFIVLIPVTAAFTEELIWRGHIISGLELRGKKSWLALLIAATSFALIHGVFFPDKLLVTFLIGIVTGFYYIRERALLPIMFAHWFMDVWSFGIFLIR
jgi:membrane protease YdiL (CAAX protease family)